jgi:arabinofuranosyltransferase
VEGYSNFSWMALLSGIWWSTGIEPPLIANALLLIFGLGTVLLSAFWLAKIVYSDAPPTRFTQLFFALALLLICSNKSFLTWLSSGLETSLFTLLMVGWAYACCGNSGRLDKVQWAAAAWLSSLLALTRPDGLLFWGITVGTLGLFAVLLRRVRLSRRAWSIALLGLAIVPIHLLWRHSYYNDWLPNTYYAKVHAPWPEMGLRYLQSYFIEFALYIPLLALLAYCLLPKKMRLLQSLSVGLAMVAAGLTIQVAYYTLIVGGDHFEYRVFHHLVPLTVIFVCAALNLLARRYRATLAILAVWLVLQAIIPWTHWYYSKDLYTRWQTLGMTVPIAAKLPRPLRPLVRRWDALQAYMIAHSVGMRHQEHKVFYLFQRANVPPRALASTWPWSDRNVLALGSVGVPAWTYANVAIVDAAGLNDRILAKQSFTLHPVERKMAHDITASRKYLDCYRPNIRSSKADIDYYINVLGHKRLRPDIGEGEFKSPPRPAPRTEPLTDEMIRACESYPWTPAELYAGGFYWY